MDELTSFLIEAKKNTYASTGGIKMVLPDETYHLEYAVGDFRYTNDYKEFNPFIGQELVWKNGLLVWGMNYFGGVYAEAAALVDTEMIYNFLKLALQHVPEEAPFRGPKFFKDENFNLRYSNNPHGSVIGFHGAEQIKWCGRPFGNLIQYRPLYILSYHGGMLTQGGLQFRPNPLQ